MNVDLPAPSPRKLFRHLRVQAGYAGGLIVVSLAIGMAGYHWVARLSWVDAFENSAMMLGGMGPVGDVVANRAGKIFAGVFALYAGLVFLAVTAFVLTPVFHYALHRFHWEASRPE
jgi:hypothetical protein